MFRFMYAIVEIAGQQFKVEAGRQIFVNRLAAEKALRLSLQLSFSSTMTVMSKSELHTSREQK